MAERLDALAREFFFSPDACPQRHQQQHSNTSGMIVAGGMRERDAAATTVHPYDTPVDDCVNHSGNNSIGNDNSNMNGKLATQSSSSEDVHFLPPLLQYFRGLEMTNAASLEGDVLQGVSPSLAPANAAATHPASAQERMRRFGEKGDAFLTGRNQQAFERRNLNTGNDDKGIHNMKIPGWRTRRRSAGGSCFTPFRHAEADAVRLSAGRVDVFANFPQLPVSDVGVSYETLGQNYQRGLDALMAHVKSCNKSQLQERSSTTLGKQQTVFAMNVDSASLSAPASTTAPGDQREGVVSRLNSLLRDLVERGEREVALHVIIRVTTWRFASKNERVTILFNHLRACLPTARISTAALAMEVWGKLHVIEANSSVYLKVASELLSLACGFLEYGQTMAEQMVGLVIIQHVAMWPGSLYRALLSNERDSLLLATWIPLSSNTFPMRLRELAAVTLRALFIMDLKQRSYRSINVVLQHAFMLLLSPKKLEIPSSLSGTSGMRVTKAGDMVSEISPSFAVAAATPTIATVAEATKSRLPLSTSRLVGPTSASVGATQGGTAGRKGNNSIFIKELKRRFFSFGLRFFENADHRRQTAVSPSGPPLETLRTTSNATATHSDGELGAFAAPQIELPRFPNSSIGTNRFPNAATGSAHKKLRYRLAQLPLPHNPDITLHAGTLAVGAFLGALRFTFPNWEPFADASKRHMPPTDTSGSSTTTTTAKTREGTEAGKGMIKATERNMGDFSFPIIHSSRSSSASTMHGTGYGEVGRRLTSDFPHDVGDDMETIFHSTESDDSVSGDVLLLRQHEEDEEVDDAVSDDDKEGEEGLEWGNLRGATRVRDPSPAVSASLQRQHFSTVTSNAVNSAFPYLYKKEKTTTLWPKDATAQQQENQHHNGDDQQQCLHLRGLRWPVTKGEQARAPHIKPVEKGQKTVRLDAFISARTLRKLVALCISGGAQSTSSWWHTERLLPILALCSPHSLQKEDVVAAVRLLVNRSLGAFFDSGEGSHTHEHSEEVVRGSMTGALHRENDIRTLSLINMCLFLAAIASSYPRIFEVTMLRHIYPILLLTLRHDTSACCPAAFPVLALLVHNIPLQFRERFQPIVEHLTGMAISQPFSTEMTGVAASVCAVYLELRPMCQTALLQRITEVLTDSGTMRFATNGANVKDSAEKRNNTPIGRDVLGEPSLPEPNSSNLREKLICFRVLQAFCMNWEGTAFFFLEVCTPYMQHPDTALRRECVLSCVRLLLSDCFHALLPEAGGKTPPTAGCMERATCNLRQVSVTSFNTNATCSVNRCADAELKPTMVSTDHDNFLTHAAYMSMRRETSVAIASTVFNRVDASGSGSSDDEDNTLLPRLVVPSLEGDMLFTCDRHKGRSHINMLREVLHRLVKTAVCDPEESIRCAALKSLTIETDQFLCTHTEIVDLLFAALNDEYPPNRVKVVRILRRLAHYTPSSVYPRLRKLLLQTLLDFQNRSAFSLPQQRHHHERGVTAPRATTSISAEGLKLLFEIVKAVPPSIPLHMDTLLQLLQHVLMPHQAAERGSVVTALRMLSYLMDESTPEELHKFEVLLELLSEQLLIRDGDADRLHAAIAVLQKIIQHVIVEKPFYGRGNLQPIVGNLQLLLYQKPSIGSELSLSVLKLLGTISSIEPDYPRDDVHDTTLMLGFREYKHSLTLPLHINTARVYSRQKPLDMQRHQRHEWMHRDHQDDQLCAYFTEEMWPDIILKALLRSFSEALNGVLAFTNEELKACLQATVAILRDAAVLHRLGLYMPSLLSVLAGLLERAGADAPLRVSAMLSIAELVELAGRAIAPMYALLVVFLDQNWMSSRYAISSCCKLLMALCKAVPDLVQEHCDWFLSLLLSKLVQLVGEVTLNSPSAGLSRLSGAPLPTPPTSTAGLGRASTVVCDVLKAIHSLHPIADNLTLQTACLALSQLLRNPGDGAGTTESERNAPECSYSTAVSAASAGFDAEVSRNIAQVLVDLLNDCEMTTTPTAVVEGALVQLWYYAEVHNAALQSLEEEMRQPLVERQRRFSSWLGKQARGALPKPVPSRKKLEQELQRRRGNQRMWFNSSSLARVLVKGVSDSDSSYAFPIDEVVTSWESPVEMDLLACVLLVAGRCRLPAVSYNLMIGEYIEHRFEGEGSIMTFFHYVTSSKYRISFLPAGTQPQPQPQQERQQQDEKHEQEPPEALQTSTPVARRSVFHGKMAVSTSGHLTASTPVGNQYAKKSPVGNVEVLLPLSSNPIPIRPSRPPQSSHSSSMSSPYALLSSPATALTSTVNSLTRVLPSTTRTSDAALSGVRGLTATSPVARCVPSDFSSYLAPHAAPVAAAIGISSLGAVGGSSKRPLPRHSFVFSSDNTEEAAVMMMTTASGANEHATSVSVDKEEEDDYYYDVYEGGGETDEQRFFRQHENLSAGEWRPWFEQFCTMLVESSDHVCISSCSQLVRRHFTIFSSDLLPIAFLSHLTKCDNAVVRRWMQLLCEFVRRHDHVPHIIAAELARLAHHIRLYSPSLFPPSLVQEIEGAYITLDLVTVLAERALNPPLSLLYLEHQLLTNFTWQSLARVLVALEDVGYLSDLRFVSYHPFVRRAAHQILKTRALERKNKRDADGSPNECSNTMGESKEAATKMVATTAALPIPWGDMLPWEVRWRPGDGEDDDNGDDGKEGKDGAPNCFRCAGAYKEEEQLLQPALLELGWFETASCEYLRSIQKTLHEVRVAASSHDGVSTSVQKGLPVPMLSPSDVVGAMRCYMYTYDFESILNMWTVIKDIPVAHEDETTTGLEQQLHRTLLGTVLAPSRGSTFSHVSRYVVSAAIALSRWDVAEEINYERFVPIERDGNDRGQRQSYKDFPFYKQLEIFRAAALTASKEYEKAKAVLASLRTALKDSYTVFHTQNTRLKFELSIMFQRISDLEEGIDAIQLKSTLGSGKSRVPGASPSSPGAGVFGSGDGSDAPLAFGAAAENKGETSGGAGRECQELHQGRRHRMAMYTDATLQRLQNIAGRPLPAHSTVLQRFETIALRSTILSPDWQLQNILVLCEQIAHEGMPRRAVQTIDHFFSLPIDSNDMQADRKYRDALLLEKYRLELQHMHLSQDLVRLQGEIADELVLECRSKFESTHRGTPLANADINQISGFVGFGPISDKHAELLLLHLECQRKIVSIRQQGRRPLLSSLGTTTSLSVFIPNVHMGKTSSSNGGFTNVAAAAAASCGPRATLCSSSHEIPELVDDNPADVLLREYRLMEHIIGSSNMITSIWREFGLLLFDVCMAIYAEWTSTGESETLENFCIQSMKAISALQKSVQFWSTTAFTSITGIGPYTTTSTHRLRHARSALPAVHLLLKSLHLAMKLDEIGAEGVCNDNASPSNTDRATAARQGENWGCYAGFMQLDFSPGMHLYWGAILPFLVNAAARHHKLHDAVRDMCARSRAMLYQCVFYIASTFEHQYSSFLMQDENGCREEGYIYESHFMGSSGVAPATTSLNFRFGEEPPTDDAMKWLDQSQGQPQHLLQSQQLWTPAGTNSPPIAGAPDRVETERKVRKLNDTQKLKQTSAMLSELMKISAEYKTIINQTIQLCEFVRSGKETSLTLGTCALPVPPWLLQRYMTEIDAGEVKPQKLHVTQSRTCPTATGKQILSNGELGVKNIRSGLQHVLHVRRQVQQLLPHCRREEVYLFLLSDGTGLRFHSIDTTGNTDVTAGLSWSSLSGEHQGLRKKISDPTVSATTTSIGAGDDRMANSHVEFANNLSFIRPLATMETAVCCLLGHLPLQFLRRPLVLPVGVREFITQLPERAVHSTGWQITLPPSLRYDCMTSMGKQPSSIFHILSEYSARYRDESEIREKKKRQDGEEEEEEGQQQQQQQRQQEERNMSAKDAASSIPHSKSSLRFQGKNMGTTITVRRTLCSQHIRQRFLAKYERFLELAFDLGQARPLCTFTRQILLSKKISAAEYPRPASQLLALLTEVEEVLHSWPHEVKEKAAKYKKGGRHSTTTSPLDYENENSHAVEWRDSTTEASCGRRRNRKQYLSAAQLTKLRLIILKSEAPRYALALHLAFQSSSADSAEWLGATHLYTHEMAEWSILQYLLDATDRESSTFFVDVITGHVASHHLGVHALQPRRGKALLRCQSSLFRDADERTKEETQGGGPQEVPSPTDSPFPCTDPTIFRLTGCLSTPLPLRCPYGVFLSSATQCLYSLLRYKRDLVGIVKFGFDNLRCFAWRGSLVHGPSLPDEEQEQQQQPVDGVDVEVPIKSVDFLTPHETSKQGFSRFTSTRASGQLGESWMCMREVVAQKRESTTSATCTADGPAQMGVLSATALEETAVSNLSTAGTNAIPWSRRSEVQEPLGLSLQQDEAAEDDRKLSASGGGVAAAGAGGAERTRGSSFFTVEASRFDISDGRIHSSHRCVCPPRLFDCASIVVKLSDELLPMREESTLEMFQEKHPKDPWVLINLHATDSTVNQGEHCDSDDHLHLPLSKRHTNGTNQKIRTILERVMQIISASVDMEKLLGTVDVPHPWRHWAPHW